MVQKKKKKKKKNYLCFTRPMYFYDWNLMTSEIKKRKGRERKEIGGKKNQNRKHKYSQSQFTNNNLMIYFNFTSVNINYENTSQTITPHI